jgi:hypothetical protein
MARAVNKAGEKKEAREDKRKRKQHQLEAEELTKKYVFPALVFVAVAIVTYFFVRYGFGSVNNASKNSK